MYLLSKIHKTPIGNITITVKTFVRKGWWLSYGAEKTKNLPKATRD